MRSDSSLWGTKLFYFNCISIYSCYKNQNIASVHEIFTDKHVLNGDFMSTDVMYTAKKKNASILIYRVSFPVSGLEIMLYLLFHVMIQQCYFRCTIGDICAVLSNWYVTYVYQGDTCFWNVTYLYIPGKTCSLLSEYKNHQTVIFQLTLIMFY